MMEWSWNLCGDSLEVQKKPLKTGGRGLEFVGVFGVLKQELKDLSASVRGCPCSPSHYYQISALSYQLGVFKPVQCNFLPFVSKRHGQFLEVLMNVAQTLEPKDP